MKPVTKTPQTIHDIASLSGVSAATVSRVLNGNTNVREETRQRVLDAMRKVNYHPNQSARSLSNRRTDCIGLVVPNLQVNIFTDPYFPTIILAISERIQENGYALMLGLGHDERVLYNQFVERQMVDGVLIVSSQDGDWLTSALLDSHIPCVMVGRPNALETSYADVDNRLAAQHAVEHLIRLKYEHIATIAGPQTMTAGEDRLGGYEDAIDLHGLPRREDYIVYGDFTEARGYRAMVDLLALDPRPDAVFCANDVTAIGAIQAIRQAGLSVPEDIAIVGFDDMPLASQVSPALTTIRQPIAITGQTSVRLLLERIADPELPTQRILLPTELIVRQSCGMMLQHGWKEEVKSQKNK
ncbi:MAG TPA: LacI family DNA-binding transcriptional regulator [Aggregatilineales bacterium]|nr:LacI family DNA-binding transcriptional regulator [Aggregatilineales bacterium]